MCNPLEDCWVNQIVHGDCIDLMQKMPKESVPLVVTSPPYGTIRAFGGHSFDCETVIEGISRIVQPGGIVVWVEQDQINDRLCSFSSFTNCHKFRQLGFELVVPLVLARSAVRVQPKDHYGTPEFALVLSKGRPRYTHSIGDRPNSSAGKWIGNYRLREKDGILVEKKRNKQVQPFGKRGSVWQVKTGYGVSTKDKFAYDHPAIMSESLAEDLIISFSRPGDLVLDPMIGAGTTAKMAILNHRKFLGFEIHEPYVEIAKERVRLAEQEQQRRMDES